MRDFSHRADGFWLGFFGIGFAAPSFTRHALLVEAASSVMGIVRLPPSEMHVTIRREASWVSFLCRCAGDSTVYATSWQGGSITSCWLTCHKWGHNLSIWFPLGNLFSKLKAHYSEPLTATFCSLCGIQQRGISAAWHTPPRALSATLGDS